MTALGHGLQTVGLQEVTVAAQQAIDEADIRQRIDTMVEAIRAMDLLAFRLARILGYT